MRHLLYIVCWLLTLGVSLKAQNYDSLFSARGLVDIQTLHPHIRVELRYATTNNFVGVNMYGNLSRAYLLPAFAQRLVKAQELLEQKHRGMSLLIYDASRPQSVQRRMYREVAGTPLRIYVAPPEQGGRHNYGVAVDLTIADAKGKPLDMGTEFDHFGEEAYVGAEAKYIRLGKMRPEVKQHRALLQSIMKAVGLRPYDKEWWHYQEPIPMREVRRRYQLLNF